MSVDFQADRILISFDEFSGLVAPGLLLHQLKALNPNVPVAVTAKEDRKNKVGMCRVDISRPIPLAQQPAVLTVIADHDPTMRDEMPPSEVADVTSKRVGWPRYLARAPKQGETVANATGTMIYRDHLGNWRRVSDDAVLKAAP